MNEAHASGHEIASHANGHFDGGSWSEAQWRSEFAQFNRLLFEAAKNNDLSGDVPALAMEKRSIVDGYRKRGIHFYPMWRIRTELGIEGLCKELRHAYKGTKAVYVHYDMDVLGGAGPAPGDILGELAEPIGMTDYEVIRIALETGKRGFAGASFICIPPGSAVVYRTIVYVIMFMLAGLAIRKKGKA